MHGVKRVKQTPEALAAKKVKEQAKITEYLALSDDVLAKKAAKDWSRDALESTTRILQINPEFYTVWNYRRNILLRGIFPESSPSAINDLLTEDLNMTTAALRLHPKVYWIWNHRRWCLENVPNGPGTDEEGDIDGWRKTNWDREMFVVDKMLDADSRNFHAWSYRRYVLAGMPVRRPETTELAYTTRKIEANFSNFSAWHQRTKLLTSLWASGRLDYAKSKEDEFELVRNAMFTDPNDQSVWIYHRWLMGEGDDHTVLEREIGVIQELLDEQPDSKWCMESQVYYKRILLRKHATTIDVDRVREECKHLLGELRKLDPARKERYAEIDKLLSSSV
ncbi:Rab geranylgeranyltransferase [Mycena indigotica]|uniref:Geranylgeranyl transferase type-2 subunit alpha n=1 Tax=Mycena indigotica TaxID=2126181 RepID=A0A8H6SAR1_9AGAR|nr:Rab geranylgeranyltransferase [Mycena indigotica]KAF7295305.1 Rab geranylgeranyltransferase [Mycena indigotica]